MDISTTNEQTAIDLSKKMETNCRLDNLGMLTPDDCCSSSECSPAIRHSSSTCDNQQETADDQQHLANGDRGQIVRVSTYPNVAPKTSEASEAVDKIRLKLLSSISEEKASAKKKLNKSTRDDDDGDELYDSLDIDELKKPLPQINDLNQSFAFRLISRFVRFDKINFDNEKVISDIIEKLKELLKFRKHYQLSHLKPEDFPKEFYTMNGLFQFGKDKNDVPIIYIRPRVHRKWSPKFDYMFRQYVAWQVELVTKSYHNAKVKDTIDPRGCLKDGSFAICFDNVGVSYSCLDMEFLRFLVRVLVDYYPTYCQYTLNVDLNWLFKSVWNLVKSWLPEDARNTVHMIAAKQLSDFIDEDEIPNCIKFNDLKASEKPTKGKHKYPSNYHSIKTIDNFAEQLSLSTNELKQFKKHVDKIRKEYEELGAI